jgi:hypothetical protein
MQQQEQCIDLSDKEQAVITNLARIWGETPETVIQKLLARAMFEDELTMLLEKERRKAWVSTNS